MDQNQDKDANQEEQPTKDSQGQWQDEKFPQQRQTAPREPGDDAPVEEPDDDRFVDEPDVDPGVRRDDRGEGRPNMD